MNSVKREFQFSQNRILMAYQLFFGGFTPPAARQTTVVYFIGFVYIGILFNFARELI